MGPNRPLRRTILVVDIQGFNRPERSNPSRVKLRATLFALLEAALGRAEVNRRQYALGDTGDGAYLLIDSDVSEAALLESLMPELQLGLKEYNRGRRDAAMMRLRVVLHTGYVTKDAHGWAGGDLNFAFRLLDSRPLREELRATSSPLALMVSEAVYEGVVRDGWGAIEPSEYRRVEFETKETRGQAWLRSTGGEIPRHDREPEARPVAARQRDSSGGVIFESGSTVDVGGDVIGGDQINYGRG